MKQLILILSLSYIWFSFREMRDHLLNAYKETEGPILNRIYRILQAAIDNALSCGKCFTFWLGLGLSLNIVIAAAASAAYDLYDRIRHRLF